MEKKQKQTTVSFMLILFELIPLISHSHRLFCAVGDSKSFHIS